MLHKRLSLLAVSIVVLSGSAIVAARFISGQPNEQKPLTMKVMRGKYHLNNKPTSQEIEIFKASQKEEREFEDSIPKHVPLKIKIKKEKEAGFKDLKNENWAREFELEVTNTGDKPIYEFYLLLVTDVKAAAGYRIVAPLSYGRPELADLKARPTKDDIPIRPGETLVLTIHASQLQAWDHFRKKENRQLPKKVQIKLQGISFGDGTGYMGNEGTLLPRKVDQTSSQGCEPPNRDGPFDDIWDSIASRIDVKPTINHEEPAIVPVNLLSANDSVWPAASSQGCCPEPGCTSLIPFNGLNCVNCPPQNQPIPTFSSDPAGGCYRTNYDSIECFTSKPGGEPFLCPTVDLFPCSGTPTPTPTPTPSPSPSPTPTPSPSPTPIPCPLTDASNCSSGVPRDYCTNPSPPGIDTGGCPPFMHADGSCCVPDPCPSPTPTPPPCEGGVLQFIGMPICNWQCLTLGTVGGEPIHNGGYLCTPYFWVWYISFDGGETWWPSGQVEYAGCW